MGIRGINALITRFASGSNLLVPITYLNGKRIAIDGNNLMYTTLSVAQKKVIRNENDLISEPDRVEVRKEWFNLAINFLTMWLMHGVTPILVYDGTHPAEKTETKNKRQKDKQQRKENIDSIISSIEQGEGDTSQLKDELKKQLSNYLVIKGDDYQLFQDIFRRIGIPTLYAVGDGEELCSALCRQGKVAAVFSTDTDNLAYGCPVLITKMSQTPIYKDGQRIPMLECVFLDKVLAGLNIPFSTFVDLCIMSGCDFNKNIPKIAGIKSYQLLQRYNSIDNLPEHLDKSVLNHHRCRQIFSSKAIESICQEPERLNELKIKTEMIVEARDLLEQAGVANRTSQLALIYRGYQEPVDEKKYKISIVQPVKQQS